MFIDKANIKIAGGKGGDGHVSFFRGFAVPNGGPDGGDGGRGGDVIFEATTGMNTLMDFRFKKSFKADDGEAGGKRNCSGKSSDNLIIKVPVGTIIREKTTGKIMADMAVDGEQKTLIKGGKGGKGNQHFATPTRQAPRYAEKGRLSKNYEVILELKLIADVGIIGFPNVGKSTLLSMATNANPKIANYHFTTLSPNLGVVRSRWGEDFILADIPGLIEGASEGVGLGHDFLRHIERTKVFVHVVDASGVEGTDPVESLKKLNLELENYNPALLERPQIIAANKMDLPQAQENLKDILAYAGDTPVFPISAATNAGIDELLAKTAEVLKEFGDTIVFEEDYEEFIPDLDVIEAFTVEQQDDGFFVVEGVGVEKMVGYTNMETEKGFAFFQRYLREKGIIEALENAGIEEGDTVKIYDMMFDYYK